MGHPRGDHGAGRSHVRRDHRAGHALDARQGGGARRAVACAGGVRDGRGRLPGRRGRPDHGAGGARTHRPARANRVRRPRRGGRAGLSGRPLTLPVLVAPASFKGTFSAREVARAIADGLRSAGREAEELPVADGGEGTMDVLMATLGGELRTLRVSDPLGRPIEAGFALLPGGSAVVEMAQASGLSLVAEADRDAWAASTRGTGELIAAAVDAGASRVVVTVGGSATTDGGAGAIEAL